MGSSVSKQSAPDGQHVFSAEGPVRFSEGFANSLQNSAETDNTRARNLELIIQSRVASELEKHLSSSQSKLSQASDSISKEPYEAPKENQSSQTKKPLLNRLGEKLGTSSSDSSGADSQRQFDPNLDRNAVASEIEQLKKKLAERKKITEMDEGVRKAKEEVATCLRINEQRPLDCWKEVETFKAEVGRLERQFVEKNGGL